jgi:hypothetical protein
MTTKMTAKSRELEAYIKLSENMSIIENAVATSKGAKQAFIPSLMTVRATAVQAERTCKGRII